MAAIATSETALTIRQYFSIILPDFQTDTIMAV